MLRLVLLLLLLLKLLMLLILQLLLDPLATVPASAPAARCCHGWGLHTCENERAWGLVGIRLPVLIVVSPRLGHGLAANALCTASEYCSDANVLRCVCCCWSGQRH